MIQYIIYIIFLIIGFYAGKAYERRNIRNLLNFNCGDPYCILCCHKEKDDVEDIDGVYSY